MRWLLPGAALAVVATVIVVMAVTLSSDSSTDVTDLEVGECFDLDLEPDADGEFVDVSVVEPFACDDPHNAQVVSTFDLNPDHELPFPGDVTLFEEADRACGERVVGDDRFGMLPITPTEATWAARRGRALCVAVTSGGVPITGDHRQIARDAAPGNG
jgi:hypothetical protein